MIALTLLTIAAFTSPPLQEEPATPPVIAIDGDEHRRYLLHTPPEGTPAPKEGWKLLVVMPGGAGNADFAPFVGRIRANALDDGWLVAQIVAPVWSQEQAQRNV